jgi:hypothetical protein
METSPPALLKPDLLRVSLLSVSGAANQLDLPISNEEPPGKNHEFLSLFAGDVDKFIEEQHN